MVNFLQGNNKKKSSDFLFYLILILFLFIVYFIMTRVFSLVIVNGSSMENTLNEGDVLFVNRFESYDRGDVIVFEYDGNMLIKRVIAVEGDEIKCERGVVSVKRNGEADFQELEEPYIIAGNKDIEQIKLKDGEIFVMGDNRPISNDSSSFGPINKSAVVGVVNNFSIKNKNWITKLFSWSFKLRG